MAEIFDEEPKGDQLQKMVSPTDKQLLQAIDAAYRSAGASGKFTDSVFDKFKSGASFRIRSVRSHTINRWFRLAAKQNEARERLFAFFKTAKSPARLSIAQSIGFNQVKVESLERQILTAGLTDKSVPVRVFALQRIEQRNYQDLLSKIKLAAAAEKDAETATRFAKTVEMLEIGCNHEPPNPGESRHLLFVRYEGGCVGVRIPDDVVKSVGLKELSRRIRIRQEWSGTYRDTLPGDSWDPVPDLENPDANSEVDRLLAQAKNAFEQYRQTEKTNSKMLSAIEAVLRSGEESAIASGAQWLVQMSQKNPPAARVAEKLFSHPVPMVRRAILNAHYAKNGLPEQLELKLLKKGLKDKDPGVRLSARLQVFAHGREALLPDLRRAHARETDPTLAEKMSRDIELMTVGHIATYVPRNKIEIQIYSSSALIIETVPQAVVDEAGLAEVVDRVRTRHYWGQPPLKGKPWDPIE